MSRREDWADAFATYIYRGSWSAAVAQSSHDIDPDALVVATDRLTFVADQIAEYQAAYANVQLYLYGDPAFDAYILSSYVDP